MTRNPKDEAATTEARPRLDLLEPAADEAIAAALATGADKYGLRNFTTSNIEARTYVAAMRRHLAAWLDGEDDAPDSGVHHLGHVGASVHVVMAAMQAGTFVDDRNGEAKHPDGCPLFASGECIYGEDGPDLPELYANHDECRAHCATVTG